ncbi:MAG: hypothetical protein Ta2D_13880 [Rickettsiales bacterium]|nr:MAG: hypothetical protein Ta2D_13880 [Rickettsiales bacterium]
MQQNFLFEDEVDIYNKDDFVIHSGNSLVYEVLTSGSVLDCNKFLLTGSKGSGKTFICNIWQSIKINATKFVLEDIEENEQNEEELLHFINDVDIQKGILLITSCKKLNEIKFNLPDLQSRFQNFYNIQLLDLDEDSKKEILQKMLNRKQLFLDNELLGLVAKKISSNYQKINIFVEKLSKINKINAKSINELLNDISGYLI